MFRYYVKEAEEELFRVIPEPCEGCWIDLNEVRQENLATLAEYLDLKQSDLNDCLDKFEIPRIERIQNTVLIFTRYPTESDSGLYTSLLTIILSPRCITTISPFKSSFISNFVRYKSSFSTNQKSKIAFSLLLKISQEFNFYIRRIRNDVLKQEKEMISVDSKDITELTRIEEILNQYMSALTPLRYMLESMVSTHHYIHLYDTDQSLLDDLSNALKQSEDLCNTSLKSIRSLRDSYQIIFTNNLHKTIKLLTALTILFNIPTMVASFYGMNVALPFSNQPLAFPYIIGATGGIMLLTVLYFQRKHWL